jgi:WD40 repeat protein
MIAAHGRGIYCAAVFEPRQVLALCSWDGSASVWDLSTGERMYTLRCTAVTANSPSSSAAVFAVRCCCFSQEEGSWLATGSDDGSVLIWDVGDEGEGNSKEAKRHLRDADGVCLLLLQAHKAKVVDIAFAETDVTLISASADLDVIVWDIANRGGIRSRFRVPWPWAPAPRALSLLDLAGLGGETVLLTLHASRIGLWSLNDGAEVAVAELPTYCSISSSSPTASSAFGSPASAKGGWTSPSASFAAMCRDNLGGGSHLLASQCSRTGNVTIWKLKQAASHDERHQEDEGGAHEHESDEKSDVIRQKARATPAVSCCWLFELSTSRHEDENQLPALNAPLLSMQLLATRPLLVTGHDCGTVGMWSALSGAAVRIVSPCSSIPGLLRERVTCCVTVTSPRKNAAYERMAQRHTEDDNGRGLTIFGTWKGRFGAAQWSTADLNSRLFSETRMWLANMEAAERQAVERAARCGWALLAAQHEEVDARENLLDEQLAALLFHVTVLTHGSPH